MPIVPPSGKNDWVASNAWAKAATAALGSDQRSAGAGRPGIIDEVELPAILGRPVDTSDLAAVGEAARAANRGVVVATLGAAGAVVATADRSWHVAAQPVVAVDTAAAGDCFIGAWMAALAKGAGYEAAADLATQAAALSVTRQGTAVSLPYRFEISGF